MAEIFIPGDPLGVLIRTDKVYEFSVGNVVYQYINLPLSASTFDSKTSGVTGNTNVIKNGSATALRQALKSLKHAAEMVAEWYAIDEHYGCGWVCDYQSRTLYYDNDEALIQVKKRF